MPEPRAYPVRPGAGALCGALGLFILGVSTGLVPSDPASFYAPRWVLGLCGGVFVVGAAMLALGDRPYVRSALAAVLLVSMGAVGGYASLFGEAEQISGGVPWLSHDTNVSISRGVFGFGALCCFALALIAAWEVWTVPGGRAKRERPLEDR